MNDEYTIAALQRQAARDALRRRRQQTQRDDLLEAARALLPEHGLALPLPRFAVHANVPRYTAAGLYNGTGELAAAYVTRAIYHLIERTAPADGASPADFLAHLIEAMRAAPEPHRVIRAMECGQTPRLLAVAREADLLLARAVGVGLSEVWPAIPSQPAPAIPPEATEDIGHRALALLHAAARAPHAPPARAEAALIAKMLVPVVASRAAQAVTDAAAPDSSQPNVLPPAARADATARRAANDVAPAPDPVAAHPTAPILRHTAHATPPGADPDYAPPDHTPPDRAWAAARRAVGAWCPHPPDNPERRHGTRHPAGLVALRGTGPPAPAHYPAGAG